MKAKTIKRKLWGREWRIKFVKEVPTEEAAEANWGFCDTGNRIIYVDINAPEDEAKSTLLHEVIEAINYTYDLELDHTQIQTLEAALFEALEFELR